MTPPCTASSRAARNTSWTLAMATKALDANEAIQFCLETLLNAGDLVDAGHWQGYETEGRPDLQTREILNMNFTCRIPETAADAAAECQPNMPWAEEEFWERVGGAPRNPHNSLTLWPWWNNQIEVPFTHTYSERFWPNDTGEDPVERIRGIRYRYGDLDDVLQLLCKYPHTRQATFPIFFPEDTGAKHGGRIPCTLHYHFMLRNDMLHLWYPIRSCDAVRHFRDDVYMAMRLDQWVLDKLRERDRGMPAPKGMWDIVVPGMLCFTAYSFHAHMGDWHLLEEELA